MTFRCLALGITGALGLTLAVRPSVAQTVEPPPPAAIVERACDAAGGAQAFQAIPLLRIVVKGDEITTDGGTTSTVQGIVLTPPGPIPARIEYPASKVIAADDGTGGWALVSGRLDARPSTTYMVKRSIATKLFPILLPFSLQWDGVSIKNVQPAELDGTPVWRLTLVFAKSFFATPQIATTWTVDIARSSNAVLRAQSPYTDLGKDIVADGMRFTWFKPVKIGAVTLPSEQHVVGLDQRGEERPHSRIDHISYDLPPASDAARIFTNPVPPAQRPRPNRPLPPGGPGSGR